MIATKSIANRFLPWRFLLFFLAFAIAMALAIPMLDWSKGLLVAFDFAGLLFLATCVPIFGYDSKRLRQVAKDADANRVVMLVLSFIVTVVILAAVVAELGGGQSLTSLDKALVAGSLVLIWIFANAVYTLHYAHLYYSADKSGKDRGGLKFPGTREPLMSDFAYFSFTLGVAVQTSDVQVHSRHIRNVITAHCVAGFFFNLGVLALTINVLGSS
ncbi:MAG: DUF1345 domain-containing protein [Sphingomicrobium sp.]